MVGRIESKFACKSRQRLVDKDKIQHGFMSLLISVVWNW